MATKTVLLTSFFKISPFVNDDQKFFWGVNYLLTLPKHLFYMIYPFLYIIYLQLLLFFPLWEH